MFLLSTPTVLLFAIPLLLLLVAVLLRAVDEFLYRALLPRLVFTLDRPRNAVLLVLLARVRVLYPLLPRL